MRSLSVVGVLLIVLGAGGLLFNHFSYTENKPILDAGPVHVEAEKEHRVSVPLVASIVLMVTGLGLVVVSRRSA